MSYKVLETVKEENWGGEFPTENNEGEIHRFKNKDELIAFLLDYVYGTSSYWNLEMVE